MSWNHVKLGGINESVRETGYERELSNGMNARVEMHHIHDRYVLKVSDNHAVFLTGDVLGVRWIRPTTTWSGLDSCPRWLSPPRARLSLPRLIHRPRHQPKAGLP